MRNLTYIIGLLKPKWKHIIWNILKARLGYSVGCKGLNEYTKRGVDYNVTNNYKAGEFFAACNDKFFF